MNKILRTISALPALLFMLIGIRWLVTPEAVAAEFGMPLLDGLGRSTQIGDLGAFFIAGSSMVFLGLITQRRTWLDAAAMLIGVTAVCRLVAWFAHDASLAVPQIAIEIIVTTLLLATAAYLEPGADSGPA
ncbi:MAG: hypothetical protein HOC23_02240 [Halieaceae bacterium]|jgi:hypothetical protein|nr:hypothetical protein [Halieaceae bacterium]